MMCGARGVTWKARSIVTMMLVWSLFVLLSKSVGAEERPIWYQASEAALVLGHTLDLSATQRCLGTNRCHETNPWLLRFESPTAFAAAKISVASLGLWATRKIPNKKVGAVVNYAIGASFSALAIRNERIGQ